MRKLTLSLCLTLLLCAGCAWAGSRSLEWDAPTHDVDGNAITAPLIYRVYQLDGEARTLLATTSNLTATVETTGRQTCGVTAAFADEPELESEMSPTLEVNFSKPGHPGGLRK